MYFLIASDFLTDYELIKASSKQQAINYISSHDTKAVEIIGCSDDLFLEDVHKYNPKTLYISDYED